MGPATVLLASPLVSLSFTFCSLLIIQNFIVGTLLKLEICETFLFKDAHECLQFHDVYLPFNICFMTIHKEGYHSIGIAALLFGFINIISFTFLSGTALMAALTVFLITLLLFLFIISFFRIPKRSYTINETQVVAPADGKVVAIEEILDVEYFHDKRIQVSIFMSPANVHVNRNPLSGIVKYSRYHKGKYLVAWHPKSSIENERHTVVIENENGIVLVKQIAGAMAKRICNYLTVGQEVKQGEELGFIKFGSRVDVLMPLNAEINVQLKQNVKGGITVIGNFAAAS